MLSLKSAKILQKTILNTQKLNCSISFERHSEELKNFLSEKIRKMNSKNNKMKTDCDKSIEMAGLFLFNSIKKFYDKNFKYEKFDNPRDIELRNKVSVILRGFYEFDIIFNKFKDIKIIKNNMKKIAKFKYDLQNFSPPKNHLSKLKNEKIINKLNEIGIKISSFQLLAINHYCHGKTNVLAEISNDFINIATEEHDKWVNMNDEENFSKLYNTYRRVFELRRIAVAKWKMRINFYGELLTNRLAQREGITLRQLEPAFDLHFDEAELAELDKWIIKKNPNEKILPKKNKDSNSRHEDDTNQKILWSFLGHKCFPEKSKDLELALDFKKLISDCISDFFDQKPPIELKSIWLSSEKSDKPVRKAVHYSDFYPEYKPQKPSKLIVAKTKKKYLSFSFKILDIEEEENVLNKCVDLVGHLKGFDNNSVLERVVGMKFIDNERPFELSSFRWHKQVLTTPFNLMPWLSEKEKNILGVDDNSRYYDDPVEFVEDDVFADYWRDVAVGMDPGKALKCEFHLRSTNSFAMEQHTNIILKHTRSIFCRMQKMKTKRHVKVTLKSVHNHGKSRMKIQELEHRHVFFFCCPESHKHKLDKLGKEIIGLGGQVTIRWMEFAD